MRKTLNYLYTLSLFLLLINSSAIACDIKETILVDHFFSVSASNLTFGSASQTQKITFATDNDEVSVSVAPKGNTWCTARIEGNTVSVTVDNNTLKNIRSAVVSLSAGSYHKNIVIEQLAYGFQPDQLVTVSKVTATSELTGDTPRLTKYLIDGDLSTFHNSAMGAITEWPFYYDFYFEDAKQVDYVVCTPRQGSGRTAWGAIGELEVWVATEETPQLVKYGDYDCGQISITPSRIDFDTPLSNPTHIQFRIKSGYNDRVSCAEVQFFKKLNTFDFDVLTIFTDASCSILRSDVAMTQIDEIPDLFYRDLAQALFLNTYPSEFRIHDCRPYQHPNVMAAKNKSGKYSLRDNPTGIYVKDTSENLIVFVGDLKGQSPTLHIRNFRNNTDVGYTLREGFNMIMPSQPGLIYIYNHTEDDIPLLLTTDQERAAAAAKTVRVHLVTGYVNGLFDITKHTNADWTNVLANYATHTEIDVVGKYTHVVWNVQDYKDNNTDITMMTEYFDRIAYDQNEFMGIFYYNRAFKNRIFISVNYSAPAAAATDYWTYYSQNGYRNVFCTEEGFLRRMWVLGHEIGHVNQVRPEMKWAGTTEVTNNLYAMYNQKMILGEAERLLDQKYKDGYVSGFANIVDAQAPLVSPANVKSNDHMLKLPPFWQLKLYFMDILKQEHFYHDLFEHYRVTTDLSPAVLGGNYHGMLQLDFVRQTCLIGKMDMTDFFIKWGFLRPINEEINDYGNKTMRITQEQIDELIAEIKAKGYPEPTIEVHTLTDENYKQYIFN